MLLPILLALLAVAFTAFAEHKAAFTLGNTSLPLSPRDLFARQYTTTCADEGYGVCDSGQCCPLDGSCCGAQRCAYEGEACCGTEGYVYPLDGSECCS